MNRLLVNGITKGKGVGSMFQRQSIMGNSSIPLRSLDSKIRDREIALEDEFVRRTEKERALRKKRQSYKNKKSKKPITGDTMLLNNKVGAPIGRLTDSGIIF
ncbi:hypothetical protein ACTA71_004918 [Dictyostelium dimigraforme]